MPPWGHITGPEAPSPEPGWNLSPASWGSTGLTTSPLLHTAVCTERLLCAQPGCQGVAGSLAAVPTLLWEPWSTAPPGGREPAMPTQAGETTMPPPVGKGGAVQSESLQAVGSGGGLDLHYPGRGAPWIFSGLGSGCPALCPATGPSLGKGWPWCGGNWLTEPKGGGEGSAPKPPD